jgi:hypothetical protein
LDLSARLETDADLHPPDNNTAMTCRVLHTGQRREPSLDTMPGS